MKSKCVQKNLRAKMNCSKQQSELAIKVWQMTTIQAIGRD